MKKFSQMINEAPIDKYSTIIGGVYTFDPDITNEEIIDTILHDFSLKCATIIKDYYKPEIGLSTLCTYEIFKNRWGINNPGDVTANEKAEQIYNEIPSDLCAQYISEIEGVNMSIEDIKTMFAAGEFPLIQIWRGYHEGRNETHVTYIITR